MTRKCKSRLRLMCRRISLLKASLINFLLLIVLLLVLFAYVQEKHSKEELIQFALGSRNVEDLVKPNNDTLILTINEEKVHNPFVVVVVTSHPNNEQRRDIIRNTWASKASGYGVAVVFFMGRPESEDAIRSIKAEAYEHRDIVVDDFTESYYALAIKTLRVFKYFKFHHPKAKFLVKTDDDVFVNVPNLVSYCYSVNKELEIKHSLNETSTDYYYVGGVIHTGRGPHTWNAFSKWYAPSHVWRPVYDTSLRVTSDNQQILAEGEYPPYAEGNFYMLSDSAVVGILKASEKVPMFHLEDVYVTGVLATSVLKIEKTSIPFVSSSSNMFPKLSYAVFKWSTSPKEIIAFHCDNYVQLISQIYEDSIR